MPSVDKFEQTCERIVTVLVRCPHCGLPGTYPPTVTPSINHKCVCGKTFKMSARGVYNTRVGRKSLLADSSYFQVRRHWEEGK